MIISDGTIETSRVINNIPNNYVAVRTAIGGAVFVDDTLLDLIQRYQTGQLTGIEPVPAGVFLRILPDDEIPVGNSTIYTPVSQSIYPILPYVPPLPAPILTPGSYYLPIRIGVYYPAAMSQIQIPINIDVLPEIPVFDGVHNINLDWILELKPIPLALTDSMLAVSRELLDGKVSNYFDQDRIGKTLLNFGEDFQSLLLNWQYDTRDPNGGTILVKLYRPLPPEIELFTELWISRELSPSYLDQLFVVFIPGEGLKVYLRPPNREININLINGHEVNNVTLQNLLTTGSVSKTDLTDPMMEEWFVTSLEGAELNIDYTNFNNFVFYSSAVKRIDAFKQKLVTLEDYNAIINEQSSSLATLSGGLSGFTSSVAFGGYQRISEQRMDLIRSFDGYERFLYYGSGSAYSSSFSGDTIDQLYYLTDATWPKVSGSLISVASASNAALYSVGGSQFTPDGDYDGLVSWLDAITYIASEYDKQNQNRLVNNLPEYLISDDQSQDFLTFVDMVGHHFDVIKSYADAMPQIFSRDSDPSVELSPDVVWNIASSFGIELPNYYAVKNLVDYTIGEVGVVSPKIYRDAASETWKRFLHNQIHLLKSKGTRTALRGLLNTYGVLPTTIQIRETAKPSFYTSQSFELIEEQTNILDFSNAGSYIQIPFSGSALPLIETIQLRFATTTVTQSVLFNVDNAWGVRIVPVTSSYASIELVNSSGVAVVTSTPYKIFDGNYYSITVQNSSNIVKLWTQRADDDGDIIDNSRVSSSFNGWTSGSTLYLGSSGSSWGTSFNGTVDEFRMWSEVLTPTTIDYHTQYPALYNGNTTTSARDSLPVRLSFNKPRNLGVTPFVLNESPYVRDANSLPLYTQFSASGFLNEGTYPYSMQIITRNVKRYTPNAGGGQFVSNKITIEDAPSHRYFADDSGSGIPILSHEKSMVTINQKFDKVLSDNTIGFYFSPTDAINDSIIKTIGNIDLQDYIGNPADIYESSYVDLDVLNTLYWKYYAYTYNYNSFVEFVENLLQPLFIQAKQLVPARAKLLTGIVLDSPILERNKIKWNRLETTGYGTDDESVTPTLYPDALTSEPSNIDASYDVLETELHDDNRVVIDASYPVHDATIELDTTSTLEASYPVHDVTIELDRVDNIESSYPTYDSSIDMYEQTIVNFEQVFIDDETAFIDYINTLLRRYNLRYITELTPQLKPYFNQLLTTYQPPSRVSVDTGMNYLMDDNFFVNTIEPYIDFSNFQSTNYFTQRDGLVLISTNRRVRLNESILSNRGTWTYGSTYARNEYVTQSNSSGLASDGDGYEYVCITPLTSGTFISYNSPSLDTLNWKRVQYIQVPAYTIRVATNINGNVELVNSGSGYTPYKGYSNKHYKFHRDSRLGTLRHLWYGCKQTDSTTIDGEPAVEIIPSAGDVLVVSTGAEPIQRINDVTGPILDIR